MTDSRVKWQLVTTVWIQQTPHQPGARVPAIIVLTQTPRFMYPWYLYFPFVGTAKYCDLITKGANLSPPGPNPGAHFWYASRGSETAGKKAKRSGIHDYFRVVLHDTFLPRWVKEQSGYWRVMWYIHYLSMKNLFSLHSFTDFIYIIYTFVTRSTSEDDTDQLDCTGLTHIPISPRNQSHRRPHDLRLSLESQKELIENLLS